MSNKTLVWGSIILGVVFVGLAVFYWMTPAGSLPSFFPGYETGVTTVHIKHGIASLCLGLALFVLAWFRSGPSHQSTMNENNPASMQ